MNFAFLFGAQRILLSSSSSFRSFHIFASLERFKHVRKICILCHAMCSWLTFSVFNVVLYAKLQTTHIYDFCTCFVCVMKNSVIKIVKYSAFQMSLIYCLQLESISALSMRRRKKYTEKERKRKIQENDCQRVNNIEIIQFM